MVFVEIKGKDVSISFPLIKIMNVSGDSKKTVLSSFADFTGSGMLPSSIISIFLSDQVWPWDFKLTGNIGLTKATGRRRVF